MILKNCIKCDENAVSQMKFYNCLILHQIPTPKYAVLSLKQFGLRICHYDQRGSVFNTTSQWFEKLSWPGLPGQYSLKWVPEKTSWESETNGRNTDHFMHSLLNGL